MVPPQLNSRLGFMNPGKLLPLTGKCPVFPASKCWRRRAMYHFGVLFLYGKPWKNPQNWWLMIMFPIHMFICFLFNVDHKFKIYQHTLFSDIQISYCWFYLQEMPICPQISHWSTTLSGLTWTIWQFGRHGAPEKLTGTCFHRGWCPGCVSRVWTPEMLAENVCL